MQAPLALYPAAWSRSAEAPEPKQILEACPEDAYVELPESRSFLCARTIRIPPGYDSPSHGRPVRNQIFVEREPATPTSSKQMCRTPQPNAAASTKSSRRISDLREQSSTPYQQNILFPGYPLLAFPPAGRTFRGTQSSELLRSATPTGRTHVAKRTGQEGHHTREPGYPSPVAAALARDF